MRLMQDLLPKAEIVVRSFDVSLEGRTVIADSLSAIGLPTSGDFANADGEAGMRNETRPSVYSMLLYQLQVSGGDIDAIHEISVAASRREKRLVAFAPLEGRAFRFLSDVDVAQARAYYAQLRRDFPELQEQPSANLEPADRRLTPDEAIALLEWLRPDISDDTCAKACAIFAGT